MDIDSYYNKLYTRYQNDIDETEEKERYAAMKAYEAMDSLTLEERADKFFYNISEENSLMLMFILSRLRKASVSEVMPLVNKLVDLEEEVVYNSVYKEEVQ